MGRVYMVSILQVLESREFTFIKLWIASIKPNVERKHSFFNDYTVKESHSCTHLSVLQECTPAGEKAPIFWENFPQRESLVWEGVLNLQRNGILQMSEASPWNKQVPNKSINWCYKPWPWRTELIYADSDWEWKQKG